MKRTCIYGPRCVFVPKSIRLPVVELRVVCIDSKRKAMFVKQLNGLFDSAAVREMCRILCYLWQCRMCLMPWLRSTGINIRRCVEVIANKKRPSALKAEHIEHSAKNTKRPVYGRA